MMNCGANPHWEEEPTINPHQIISFLQIAEGIFHVVHNNFANRNGTIRIPNGENQISIISGAAKPIRCPSHCINFGYTIFGVFMNKIASATPKKPIPY